MLKNPIFFIVLSLGQKENLLQPSNQSDKKKKLACRAYFFTPQNLVNFQDDVVSRAQVDECPSSF